VPGRGATLGGPGKYTFCFAEDETDPTWEPLAHARGIAPGRSAVTLFQGDGIQGFIDQRSRTPEEITRSFGSPAEIGRLFLTDHLLAFEITSIVLLVAAVGGVVLGMKSSAEDDA